MERFFQKMLITHQLYLSFNSESKITSKTMLHKLSSNIGVSEALTSSSVLNYDSPISIMFFNSSNIRVLFQRRMLCLMQSIQFEACM